MLEDVLNAGAKAILSIMSVTCCRSWNTEFLSCPNTVLWYNYVNAGRGTTIGRRKNTVKISDLYHLEPLSENGMLYKCYLRIYIDV